MDDYFIIPVSVDGQELEFEGRLLLQGYIHRIEVMVNEVPVLFEPDEEKELPRFGYAGTTGRKRAAFK